MRLDIENEPGKLWCAPHVTDCAGLCLLGGGRGASCGVHLT